MVTRVAVVGKTLDSNCGNFDGEVFIESFDSLYKFFQEARGIMRRFPVGRVGKKKNHLGILIDKMMRDVLRPFLEKRQTSYRHWWDSGADKKLLPLERQKHYAKYKLLVADWQNLRLLMRGIQRELVKTYELVDAAI